jgi:hypothetical protein
MTIKKEWVRRGRDDGKETSISADDVKRKLDGYYLDIELAMSQAFKEWPLTTGYADYYPAS